MIKRLDISGVHTDLTPELKKYVNSKIGRLDRFLPRHARESAHVEVFIKESKSKSKKQQTCEVIMKLPGETIAVKESTMNIYAAVDIVEAKLKNTLKKYKEKHSSLRLHKRVISKFKRRG